MLRWLPVLLMGYAAVTPADTPADLATASQSPHDLAAFVESHSDFDWAPLWTALRLNDPDIFLPRCERSSIALPGCTAKLIAIPGTVQTILVLQQHDSMFEVFLRYFRTGPNQWRFGGAFSPYVKYFPPEHHVVRVGMKPFLTITGQGNAGTGLSTTLEYWLDLTSNDFAPVFRYTIEGHNAPFPQGIARTVRGVAAFAPLPVESITIAYEIDFRAIEQEKEMPIGKRHDRVVFERSGDGKFTLNPKLSTASQKQIESFYEELDSNCSSPALLEFNFEGFKAVASSSDQAARGWLRRFLADVPETNNVGVLKSMLR